MKLTDYHLYTTSFNDKQSILSFDYERNTFHYKCILQKPNLDVINVFGAVQLNEENSLIHLIFNSKDFLLLDYTFLENKIKFDYDLYDFFVLNIKTKKDFWMYYNIAMALEEI